MLEQIWSKFKDSGFSGSVSVRDDSGVSSKSDPDYNDKFIHDAVFLMDPEYKYVKVIHEGFNGPLENMISVTFGDDTDDNREALDLAVFDGLAHLRIFREMQTGAIVQFGYDLNEA